MNRKSKQPRVIYGRIEKGHIPARSLRTLSQDDPKFPKKIKALLTKNASTAKEKAEEEKRIQEAIAQQDRRDEIERTTGKPSRFSSPQLLKELEARMPDVSISTAQDEVVRRRPPSQRPGYARKNRENMVGLGVEIPISLRDELQKVLDLDPKKTKQGFVIELLEAVVKEYKPGEPIQLPEKFKKDADSIRRAVALMVASLK
jgi:hypothetical protein